MIPTGTAALAQSGDRFSDKIMLNKQLPGPRAGGTVPPMSSAASSSARIRLPRTAATFEREAALLTQGVWPVAGCDEVGRGPLAGPVVAAAVILDPARVPQGLNDSKKLKAHQREMLFAEICASASVSVAIASPARIDRDNILRASLWALARAVRGLADAPNHVFVDGRDRIDVACGCEPVIGGDALIASIAAASIVAKVARDRLMMQLGAEHPGYGFERHMGYGVPAHMAALRELGPCTHHRRSFAPIAALFERQAAVPMPQSAATS